MISIIVPAYKVEKFLPKCIESLINQTYRDLEIILVNDGSPDNCGRICDEYAQQDSRIQVIHQPNMGVSAARNAGLYKAHGEYVGFCDPDDFCAADMYEYMLKAMENHHADMVACGYDYFNEEYQRDESRAYEVREDELMSREEIYRKLADMPPTIRHGVVTKLFRKSVMGNLQFNTKLKSAEDGNFLLDYLQHVSSAVFVHHPLYCNLVRQGSATHGGLNVQSLKDSFEVHDRMYWDTVSAYPHLKGYAIAFLLDVCTLKYNESKARMQQVENQSQTADHLLSYMRSYIRRKALKGILSNYIHWKLKIYYLLLWIRNREAVLSSACAIIAKYHYHDKKNSKEVSGDIGYC